jgi:hypothetical protein
MNQDELRRRLQDEEDRHAQAMQDAHEATARQIDDLRMTNQRNMQKLREQAETPEALMRLAELDGYVDTDEARIIVESHLGYVARANHAVSVWLGQRGHNVHLGKGDTLYVHNKRKSSPRPDPLTKPPAHDISAPMTGTLEGLGLWLLHPRKQQKLIWLAIVLPTVIVCLMELL